MGWHFPTDDECVRTFFPDFHMIQFCIVHELLVKGNYLRYLPKQ